MTQMRRRGFTLIEILVAIGILILLVGIAAYGLSKVVNTQRHAATRVALQNARSMLSEYETASKGLHRQPFTQWWNDAEFTTPMHIWTDANPDNNAGLEPDPAVAPRDVSKEGGLGQHGRYSADQVANTQLVLWLMRQAPTVRSALNALPSSQLMEPLPAGLTGVKLRIPPAGTIGNPDPYTGAASPLDPPLLLDGWGNPIIFCPAGGLAGTDAASTDPDAMFVGGKRGDADAKQVVPRAAAALVAGQVGPIKSRDNRPFWASAGPDGNFLTGDDNLYSFEE